MEEYRLNQKVVHRAFKYTGRIVDFPMDYTSLSHITIKRDDTGREQEIWIPSIKPILDEEEELDWE